MNLNDKSKMAMTGKKWEWIIPTQDVKEFIRDVLKDCKIKWDKGNFVLANVQEIIEERAGKELI